MTIMSNSYKKVFILSLFLLATFFSPTKIFGNEVNLNLKNETINPGSFYYPFKRVWEKITTVVFFWPQAKLSYSEDLLEVRLSELQKIVTDNQLNDFQQASERFSYQAGVLVDQLINSTDEKKKEVKEEFNNYIRLLTELRDMNQANSSYWLLIQQNIDSLNILSNKL